MEGLNWKNTQGLKYRFNQKQLNMLETLFLGAWGKFMWRSLWLLFSYEGPVCKLCRFEHHSFPSCPTLTILVNDVEKAGDIVLLRCDISMEFCLPKKKGKKKRSPKRNAKFKICAFCLQWLELLQLFHFEAVYVLSRIFYPKNVCCLEGCYWRKKFPNIEERSMWESLQKSSRVLSPVMWNFKDDLETENIKENFVLL